MATAPRPVNRTGSKVSARAGNLTVSTTAQRPSWQAIHTAYMRIHNTGDTAAKYKLIGGPAEAEYKRAPKIYENACALRLSYALNHGGMPINKNKRPTGGTQLKGADNNLYYTGVYTVRDFLVLNWGTSDKPYKPYKVMSSKAENTKLASELTSLNKKGIICMKVTGWDDAAGHITLWDGTNFSDGTNYLLDRRDNVIVTEFQFWELK